MTHLSLLYQLVAVALIKMKELYINQLHREKIMVTVSLSCNPNLLLGFVPII